MPSPRAAHAACRKENENIIVFGGAKRNGGFTSSELYVLDLTEGEYKAKWSIIPTKDLKPPRRYGHTMVYIKPHLIIFGGVLKSNNKNANDTWVINLENLVNNEYEWMLVEIQNMIVPPSRMYHSAGVIKSGRAKGMILIYGGRTNEKTLLNDVWGLRRHRNGKWEWVNIHLIYR